MNTNNQVIDQDSLMAYHGAADIIPDLNNIIQRAQDENPDIQPLGIHLINLDRLSEELATYDITTIEQLDKKLHEHQVEIVRIFDTKDSGYIASHHASSPIYILLEII